MDDMRGIFNTLRHSDHRHRQRGFSLVELAVVIVVISLMIAGTMAGMGLLRVSGIKVLVAESNDFKAAMRQFENLYEGLPGDLRNANEFWATGVNGDGDGQVEPGAESANAATHLALANLISGPYSGAWDINGYVLGIGNNTMRSKVSEQGAVRIVCCSGSDYARDLNFDNHLNFFAVAVGTVTERQGVVSPIEAFGIDHKIDDGFPDSGFVGAQGNWNGSSYSIVGCYADAGASDHGTYLSADATFKNREDVCQMMFAYDW